MIKNLSINMKEEGVLGFWGNVEKKKSALRKNKGCC